MRPALRCFNCQRLGHVAAVCKGTRRCCKFGGGREYGQCGEGIEPKFCDCGGAQGATFLGCKAQVVVCVQMFLKDGVAFRETAVESYMLWWRCGHL